MTMPGSAMQNYWRMDWRLSSGSVDEFSFIFLYIKFLHVDIDP